MIRKWSSIALVLIVFLSVTISSAFAADTPPVEVQDEDGDMVIGEVAAFVTKGISEKPDLEQFTLRQEEETPVIDQVSPDYTPYPFSPVNEYVTSKTPKFYFYEYGGATKYRIIVIDTSTTPKLVYEYTGAAACSSGLCWLKPDIPLKIFDLSLAKGSYVWAVKAKIGGEWQNAYSDTVSFAVYSKGFNSTFDLNASKWLSLLGDWFLVEPGYLKSKGVISNTSCVIQKELFADYYVYEVKMKRKYETVSNRIIFHGYPYSLGSTGHWDDAYYFQYTNDSRWSLYKLVNGVPSAVIDWTHSDYIKPYDWNTLTVYTDYPFMDFWINGQYVGCTGTGCGVEEIDYDAGWVGLGMYKETTEKSPLLVDYAKLKYAMEPPYPYPWPWGFTADGERVLVDTTFEFPAPASGVDQDPDHSPGK